MITKEDEFVGREREISDILARIRNGNSVSVVGERRIGKSSLLYHLYLTGNRRLDDEARKRYQFLYLDLLNPTLATLENFAQWVLESLALTFDAAQLKDNPLIALAKGLEKFKETQKFPILLMDEFEELTQKPELFNDRFFEALRSFCNGGFMAIVTASLHTLKELTDSGNLTSPFWNIFANRSLGGFIIDDTLNEVAVFLTHFWQGKLEPSEAEQQFLLANADIHPLIMQIISYHLLCNRELNLSEKDLKEEIVKEMGSFFRNNPERVIKAIKQTTDWIEKTGNLSQLTCTRVPNPPLEPIKPKK
jgi:hypothetical protein